ncbi:MAG: NAD(P)/FAD-dependent oxidoreductase [Candidatus Nealsonbacteria bacterium]
MFKNNQTIFDVAVIGAGPAGLMTAGRAAELGKKVVLLEKNKKPGRKLVLTGKGRCNITNAEFDLKKLVENYGKKGQFLFHAFHVFGPQKAIEFFEKWGLKTKIERGKRVFPVSDDAQDVLNVFIKYLLKGKVSFVYGTPVIDIERKKHHINKLILKEGEIIARNYIICTGGKSYPATGSTGDGYEWVKKVGHSIEGLMPALAPLKIREKWVGGLQGLSLKNVEVTILQENKKEFSVFGECLFTHFGLSGPIILDASLKVGELLHAKGGGAVEISLDLKPALDFETLDARLQRDLQKYHNKLFQNCLDDLLPQKMIPVIIKFSGIDPLKKATYVTREERHILVRLLKNLKMTVAGLSDFESAIVTAGGVSLKEIDDKTMKSRIVDNLFFAGEIIDVTGPSGGFNLQICWSTGYLAGENA